MNTRERRQKLLEELREHKRIFIDELAKKFDVSGMTIRRDVNRLAAMGIVTLVQSGAVFNEGGTALPNVTARERQMKREKNIIASYCANLVKEGNAVYLDCGTTAMNIAEALIGRQNIAVISNSLPVLNILSGTKDIQLFALSGIYKPSEKGFFGDMTQRAVRNFRIDMAFFGVSAISVERGLMSSMPFEQALKRTLFEVTRQKILVTDHTKIGQELFLKVCDIDAVDKIITNSLADERFVTKARRLGVDVIQVAEK